MILIKYIFLVLIFIGSCLIGFLISNKYKSRVKELKEFKEATNILENKIKFTYEPLGDIFDEITKITKNEKGIANIFQNASINMKNEDITKSWENAIDDSKQFLSLNKEDINILKGLGKLLRKN